jgi:hypothetical protein
MPYLSVEDAHVVAGQRFNRVDTANEANEANFQCKRCVQLSVANNMDNRAPNSSAIFVNSLSK